MSRFDDLGPEELLRALGTVVSQADRLRLLKHPRMPVDGLLELSSACPRTFSGLPVVRLLLATDPSFYDRIPESVRVYMLRHGHLGVGTLERLSRFRSASVLLRQAAASSPLLTESLAWKFMKHAEHVRLSLSGNPVLTLPVLEALLDDGSVRVRTRLAGRRDLPETFYERLGQDEKVVVLWTLAGNRACARTVISELLSSPYPPIRVRAAGTMRIPPGVIPLRELIQEHMRSNS